MKIQREIRSKDGSAVVTVEVDIPQLQLLQELEQSDILTKLQFVSVALDSVKVDADLKNLADFFATHKPLHEYKDKVSSFVRPALSGLLIGSEAPPSLAAG